MWKKKKKIKAGQWFHWLKQGILGKKYRETSNIFTFPCGFTEQRSLAIRIKRWQNHALEVRDTKFLQMNLQIYLLKALCHLFTFQRVKKDKLHPHVYISKYCNKLGTFSFLPLPSQWGFVYVRKLNSLPLSRRERGSYSAVPKKKQSKTKNIFLDLSFSFLYSPHPKRQSHQTISIVSYGIFTLPISK